MQVEIPIVAFGLSPDGLAIHRDHERVVIVNGIKQGWKIGCPRCKGKGYIMRLYPHEYPRFVMTFPPPIFRYERVQCPKCNGFGFVEAD